MPAPTRSTFIDLVKLLLNSKADPNSRDMFGNTALHNLVAVAYPVPLPYEAAPEIARLFTLFTIASL